MSILREAFRVARSRAAAALGRPSPTMLILEPTLRCDSRCRTCYNMLELNAPGAALTLEDAEGLARELPDLVSLLLSGGEPCLHGDLSRLAGIFARRTPARYLYIPTNGLRPREIAAAFDAACAAFPGRVIAGLSIDGLGARHDAIRGVPGNFEKLGRTYASLAELKGSRKNLRISATTCVCADNRGEARAILRWVEANWPEAEGHSVSLIRAAPDPAIDLDGAAFLEKEGPFLAADARARRPFELGLLGKANAVFWAAYYEEALRHHRGLGRRWTCSALSGSLYINAKREVFACELRRPVGRLPPGGAGLSELLRSQEARRERGRIRRRECSCDHACFLQHSAFTEPANAGLWLRGLARAGLGRA